MVAAVRPKPSSATAKRCSVAYGTSTPWRRRSRRTFDSFTSARTFSSMNARCSTHRAQVSPCVRPAGARSSTASSSTRSSVSAPSLTSPRRAAAAMYRRTVFRSRPSCSAMRAFGTPLSHSRIVSLISTIVTSR